MFSLYFARGWAAEENQPRREVGTSVRLLETARLLVLTVTPSIPQFNPNSQMYEGGNCCVLQGLPMSMERRELRTGGCDLLTAMASK